MQEVCILYDKHTLLYSLFVLLYLSEHFSFLFKTPLPIKFICRTICIYHYKNNLINHLLILFASCHQKLLIYCYRKYKGVFIMNSVYYRQAMIISLQTIPVSNQMVRQRYTGRNTVLLFITMRLSRLSTSLYLKSIIFSLKTGSPVLPVTLIL